MRVSLPDRPGSLGAVASAMGTVGADIHAVEIIERSDDYVIDDFMLAVPDGTLHDSLVSACTRLDGVEVLWLSRYPESWGLESDIELLNRMTEEPAEAAEILTDAAPVVFHCHWAVLANRDTLQPVFATAMAPDLVDDVLTEFGPLTKVHDVHRPEGWLPQWSESVCLVAPVRRHRVVILGRQGGPRWLNSEIARLRFLAGMIP